ncbi:MAG: hypothetical protein P8H62_14305 [Henriciella sp.]|nr:hypothetical protein [Henriciella sp.]
MTNIPARRVEKIAQDLQADRLTNMKSFEREIKAKYSKIISEPLPDKLLETIEAIRTEEKRNAEQK